MTTDSKPGSLPAKAHLQGASESLLQSLASRLQRLRLSLTNPEAVRLEKIRTGMLQALAACSEGSHPLLSDRIRFATDLESLWYLRTELLAVMTQALGPDAAGRGLEDITRQFIGVLPLATTRRRHRPK